MYLWERSGVISIAFGIVAEKIAVKIISHRSGDCFGNREGEPEIFKPEKGKEISKRHKQNNSAYDCKCGTFYTLSQSLKENRK